MSPVMMVAFIFSLVAWGFENILRSINRAIYEKKKSPDFLIGHAFFINKTMDDLKDIINKKIIPLLNEYFYMSSGDVIDILS